MALSAAGRPSLSDLVHRQAAYIDARLGGPRRTRHSREAVISRPRVL
jgi:hypothetical protein